MDLAQREEFEIAKLEKLLAMVREPPESTQNWWHQHYFEIKHQVEY